MLKKGFYKHFKGNIYELLDIAKNSETLEDMVIYRACYDEKDLWVRPACMWDEEVEKDGKAFKRFTYIGEKAEDTI